MGSVRTEQIKRTAKELIKKYPDRFSTDFENNKHMVNALVQGGTQKVRNQIAGYITRSCSGAEVVEEPIEAPEVAAESE